MELLEETVTNPDRIFSSKGAWGVEEECFVKWFSLYKAYLCVRCSISTVPVTIEGQTFPADTRFVFDHYWSKEQPAGTIIYDAMFSTWKYEIGREET